VFKKQDAHAGRIVEIVAWSVPCPVPPSEHGFKYRLVFLHNNHRIFAYDNELPCAGHTGLFSVCCWTIRCARSLVYC
jgi:hypothetical protein